MSTIDRKRANKAGKTNQNMLPLNMAHLAINAPINGPMMNPIENAIPTKA